MGSGKQVNTEAFEGMGYEVGQAFAAYMRGMIRGFADFNEESESVTESTTASEDDQEQDNVKSNT
jgi:hypothetical protein